MRYFVDTEFIDNGYGPIELISLGIVAEDGREYYAVSQECRFEWANDWVRANVLPQMQPELARPRRQIRDEVLAFVEAGGGRPEFWAYMAAYDWVVFCELFGTLQNLPEHWPRYFRDLRQYADLLEDLIRRQADPRLRQPRRGRAQPDEPREVRLPESTEIIHHALWDARWNRAAWERLDQLAAKWFGTS